MERRKGPARSRVPEPDSSRLFRLVIRLRLGLLRPLELVQAFLNAGGLAREASFPYAGQESPP
jgi:hypothetical protein